MTNQIEIKDLKVNTVYYCVSSHISNRRCRHYELNAFLVRSLYESIGLVEAIDIKKTRFEIIGQKVGLITYEFYEKEKDAKLALCEKEIKTANDIDFYKEKIRELSND